MLSLQTDQVIIKLEVNSSFENLFRVAKIDIGSGHLIWIELQPLNIFMFQEIYLCESIDFINLVTENISRKTHIS